MYTLYRCRRRRRQIYSECGRICGAPARNTLRHGGGVRPVARNERAKRPRLISGCALRSAPNGRPLAAAAVAVALARTVHCTMGSARFLRMQQPRLSRSPIDSSLLACKRPTGWPSFCGQRKQSASTKRNGRLVSLFLGKPTLAQTSRSLRRPRWI